ncbi:MAG TPA: lysozyme [Pseudolabrys sp.]|nr:lysozyme [Pseudolabrys sp.]
MAREGVRLKAYRDSVGVLTIGVGHTSSAGPPEVTPGLTITQAECDEIFALDLVKYETAVNSAVKVPLSQNQFDACVSLCYNIGPSGFSRSTVAKRINSVDMAGAADAFLMWSKPPEILGRRRGEVAQFKTPYVFPPPPPLEPKPSPQPAPPSGWLSAILSIFARKT